MNEDGHTSNIRDKILTINVKQGWRAGTKITFPKEGDQGPNNIPGNKVSYHTLSPIENVCLTPFARLLREMPVEYEFQPFSYWFLGKENKKLICSSKTMLGFADLFWLLANYFEFNLFVSLCYFFLMLGFPIGTTQALHI